MSKSITMVVCAAGTALSLSAATIGHWRFSGTPSTAATVGTTFPNLVSGTGVGAAQVFNFDATKDVSNYGSYFTNAFDAPFTAVRASLTNETLLATGVTSAYVMRAPARVSRGTNYYDTAVGDRGLPIRIDDPNDKLKCSSFTIEMIVRDGSYNSARAMFSMPGAGMDAFRVMGLAGTSICGYIGVSNTVSNAAVFDATIGNNNKQSSFDTVRYHHLALVVNGTTHQATLYRDGEVYRDTFYYGTTRNKYAANDVINYLPGAPLIVGASMNGSNCCHNVQFEELRYSDEALAPRDFLRKAAPQIADKAALVYLPFDTGYASDVYDNQLRTAVATAADNATSSAAATWTGNMPTFVTDVWKPAVRDGHRNVLRKENLGSLAMSTGSVYYADCALLPNEPKITIEFFFKLSALPESPIELLGTRNFSNTSMNSNNGGGKPWYITYNHDGRLACSMYGTETAQSKAQTGPLPGLVDGAWHHCGVTIDRNASGLAVITVYVDYKLESSTLNPCTASTALTYSWNATPLCLSYGYANGAALRTFVGQIDEVRISKGVLAVSDFLVAGNPRLGFSFSLR